MPLAPGDGINGNTPLLYNYVPAGLCTARFARLQLPYLEPIGFGRLR
jgi:hypothetical protein